MYIDPSHLAPPSLRTQSLPTRRSLSWLSWQSLIRETESCTVSPRSPPKGDDRAQKVPNLPMFQSLIPISTMFLAQCTKSAQRRVQNTVPIAARDTKVARSISCTLEFPLFVLSSFSSLYQASLPNIIFIYDSVFIELLNYTLLFKIAVIWITIHYALSG